MRIESTFKAHERVSKETNPHTTSKCISTDIQGLMQKVHPKLEAIFLQNFHFWNGIWTTRRILKIGPFNHTLKSICMVLVLLHLPPVPWICMFLYLITHKTSPQPMKGFP
jgi:hypothetical protein